MLCKITCVQQLIIYLFLWISCTIELKDLRHSWVSKLRLFSLLCGWKMEEEFKDWVTEEMLEWRVCLFVPSVRLCVCVFCHQTFIIISFTLSLAFPQILRRWERQPQLIGAARTKVTNSRRSCLCPVYLSGRWCVERCTPAFTVIIITV